MDKNLHLNPSFDLKLDNCPLCESVRIDYFDRDYKGIRIYKCLDCENKFMNPQFSDEHLNSLYTNYIDPKEISGTKKEWDKAHIISHQIHFQSIEKTMSPGKLLSFGCGNGKEIQIALERGWTVHAYDVDPDTIDQLKKKYDAKFYCDNFFNLNLPDGYYDCIYLDQVIEHLKTPSKYLNEFKRLLRSGGILFIATPNIESIASRWKSLLGILGLKRHYGKHYDTWHHLLYFSPKSLKKLLINTYGFEIVALKNDVFISPNLPRLRSLFLKLATKISIMWRTTFFIISRKN